mmetsp:Transcript_13722/g.33775  ORF Transcript_13722/g.33775 Transcript_13722/m.33775 type:complete len:308 (-) Transcript_13722:112-1035(-)
MMIFGIRLRDVEPSLVGTIVACLATTAIYPHPPQCSQGTATLQLQPRRVQRAVLSCQAVPGWRRVLGRGGTAGRERFAAQEVDVGAGLVPQPAVHQAPGGGAGRPGTARVCCLSLRVAAGAAVLVRTPPTGTLKGRVSRARGTHHAGLLAAAAGCWEACTLSCYPEYSSHPLGGPPHCCQALRQPREGAPGAGTRRPCTPCRCSPAPALAAAGTGAAASQPKAPRAPGHSSTHCCSRGGERPATLRSHDSVDTGYLPACARCCSHASLADARVAPAPSRQEGACLSTAIRIGRQDSCHVLFFCCTSP